MAEISTYSQDGTVNGADKVIGTDGADGTTKNYTLDSIAAFIGGGGGGVIYQPTDDSTIVLTEGDTVVGRLTGFDGNVYEIGSNPPPLTSASNFANAAFMLRGSIAGGTGTTITSDGDAITQINDSNEIQVDVSGTIATLDLQTTNKPAPNNEIIGIGVGNNEVSIASGDIKFRDFATFGGGVANQNEVVRLPVIGRAFIRTAAGVSPSIGGIALSTEALVLRTITENPDDWEEITLGQAYSLAQGERLPGDTGTGEIITDNGDGTFTENRTNIPRTLTQITQAGSAPGDTWLLIDDDLPTVIDENTFPYGIWLLTDTPGGMYVWVFTGTLTQWNRNVAYVPNQIAQLIVDDEITTFEAHTRTGDTLPANTFNFGIEPGVTVGWEDLWTRINSYTDAARIRVVNTLPGGIATQTSTPSYDDGRVVQDNDIVILSIPIADVLTTIVDKDTIPPGLYRFRILAPTQQTWIQSDRGLQWNSNLIYLQGEVVFNSVGSTNAVETPFRALSTVGVDTEPGVHADSDTFWQRLTPYVGELLEEVEDGLRVQQTGGREQIDFFNNPASGNNATPTSWRLTLNEDEQNAANVATLPELIASSKWGIAPIGVKPDGLDWDEIVTPITHDSVTGTIDGGDELGAAFSHGGGTNLNSLVFTFDNEDERNQVKAQYFLPNVRAIGPFPINVDDAGIIRSTVDIGTTQLEVFFETPIGAVAAIAPSDNNGSNLAIYSANRALVKHIEGGTYTAANETLTITSGTGGGGGAVITTPAAFNALTPTSGDIIRVSGFSQVIDDGIRQLMYDSNVNNVPTGGVGNQLVLARYDSSGADLNAGLTYLDQTTYINFQMNHENSAVEDEGGRYNLMAGTDLDVSVNPAGIVLYYSDDLTGPWTTLGTTADSTDNGHEGRIRMDPTSVATAIATGDLVPGVFLGFLSETPITQPLDDGEAYIYNGTTWIALDTTDGTTSLPLTSTTITGTNATLIVGVKNIVDFEATGTADLVLPDGVAIGQVTTIYNLSGNTRVVQFVNDNTLTLGNVTRINFYDDNFIDLIWFGTGWMVSNISQRGGGNITLGPNTSITLADDTVIASASDLGGGGLDYTTESVEAQADTTVTIFFDSAVGDRTLFTNSTGAIIEIGAGSRFVFNNVEYVITESIATINTAVSIDFHPALEDVIPESTVITITAPLRTTINSNLVLPDLPHTDGGLDVGQLYNSGGVVQIAGDSVSHLFTPTGLTTPAISLGGSATPLDDYEEGTWTPIFADQPPGNLSVDADYTKIGDEVFCRFTWRINASPDTVTSTDFILITGFPFTPNSTFVGEAQQLNAPLGGCRLIATGGSMVLYLDLGGDQAQYVDIGGTSVFVNIVYETND